MDQIERVVIDRVAVRRTEQRVGRVRDVAGLAGLLEVAIDRGRRNGDGDRSILDVDGDAVGVVGGVASIPSGPVAAAALELANDLGARHAVNSAEEDLADAVDDLTDGEGAKQILDFVGADETTGAAPDIVAAGGDHHIIGYGGHIHEPCQALVDGEFSFKGTLVGQYAELQELVALVDRGDVELRTERYDLEEINTVAERLEHNEIEGRAVVLPP